MSNRSVLKNCLLFTVLVNIALLSLAFYSIIKFNADYLLYKNNYENVLNPAMTYFDKNRASDPIVNVGWTSSKVNCDALSGGKFEIVKDLID